MKEIVKYVLIGCLFSFCECSLSDSGKNNSGVIKINVTYKLPSYEKIENIELITDSINIYYFQKFKVYELNTYHVDITDSAWRVDSIVHYYVGIDTTAKTAFKSKSLLSPVFKKVSLDSFITSRPSDLATVDKLLPLITFDRIEQAGKDIDIHYYRIDHPGLDSVAFEFDKSMVGLPFSYSRYFDSLYQSKLTKIQVKLTLDTSINAQYLNKFRYITWQFRHMEPGDKTGKIITFCEKLEAAYRKL